MSKKILTVCFRSGRTIRITAKAEAVDEVMNDFEGLIEGEIKLNWSNDK